MPTESYTLGGNPGLVERPRLIKKLHQATAHKLTLISAPPGYGKTTLASQFMREVNLPVVWHSIEANQRDLPLLQQRALTVLEPLAPGIKNLPPVYGYPPVELATKITEYLRDYLSGEALYIIDDAHYLTGSLPAETWLRTLIEQLPAHCHAVIISRTLPDLPLAEMISRREILAIGQEELKFQRDEIQALATRLSDDKPPKQSEVEDWELRLQGWPAGTVLAIQPLPSELTRVMLRSGDENGPEALFNSLAQSMLHSQPPDLQEFLLASSTLECITPELCTEALNMPDSTFLLVDALNRNMFLSRVTGGLAYHALFRTFLQNELYDTDPHQFRDLHLRAAQWFEKNDEIITAVDHYMVAGQFPRVIDLVERVADNYFQRGQVETLLYWLDALEHTQPSTPRLLCACAKIHTDRYEYDTARSELRLAEKIFQRHGNQSGIADVIVLRAMLLLQLGKYSQAAQQANQVLQEYPVETHLRGRAYTILGTAHLNLGDIIQAQSYLEEALPFYRADGDQYALSIVLQNLEVAYISLGHLDKAAACLQEVVALRRELGNTGALALALNNLGVYYHEHNDYEQALDTFQEGLSVVTRIPNKRAHSYLLWSLGDLQRDRGAFHEARQHYNTSLSQIEGSEPYLFSAVLVNMSVLERRQGKMREAINYATKAATLAESHDLGLVKAQAQVAIWAARIESDSAQALTRLTAIIEEIRKTGAQAELMQAMALCACAALANNQESVAQDHLHDALEIAEELGSAQPLAVETLYAPELEALVKPRQARYGLLVEALRRLRDNLQQPKIERKPNITLFNQDTFRLRVCTLGREVVERDGQTLSTGVWRASAARELFFFLLFAGPVNREQINLEFWPDSSDKQARQRFHTTIYRARQALGEKIILYENDFYFFNPETEIWCDAHELENYVTQARLHSPRDPRTEELWRKAVDLYKGDFLADMDREWIIARRQALYEAYIEGLIGLGECARQRRDFRSALDAFKNALDQEPYREDINRKIMVCYADLGEKHQVMTQFNAFSERLRQDLAVEPSAETVALAHRLLA